MPTATRLPSMTPRQIRVAMVRPMNRRMGWFFFSFGSFGGLAPPGSRAGCSRRLLFTFTLRPAGAAECSSPLRRIFLISLSEIEIASYHYRLMIQRHALGMFVCGVHTAARNTIL